MNNIGTEDINVHRTGINQAMNTITQIVIIYGNHPQRVHTIYNNHIVNIVFTIAIIDCALNITPNHLSIFNAIIL